MGFRSKGASDLSSSGGRNCGGPFFRALDLGMGSVKAPLPMVWGWTSCSGSLLGLLESVVMGPAAMPLAEVACVAWVASVPVMVTTVSWPMIS